EGGRIAFDAEAISEGGSAEVFADKGDAAGVFEGDFLYQQTCRVGDVSSVGPADEGELDGFASGWRKRGGRSLRSKKSGNDTLEDDLCAAPLVGTRCRAVWVIDLRSGALEGEGRDR